MLTAWGATLVAETATSDEPYMVLINYGALGIIIILILTGQFRTKAEVQRLEEQNREQREIIKTFQMQLTTQTLPAMSKSAQVLEAIPDKETAMFEELSRTQAATKEILARMEKLSQPRKE